MLLKLSIDRTRIFHEIKYAHKIFTLDIEMVMFRSSFEDGDGNRGEKTSPATNSWRTIRTYWSIVVIHFCKMHDLALIDK